MGNSDPYGNWPQWLETVVAVGVGVAVVAAVVASAVVTGPVAVAVASVALGTSLGALVGGAYSSNNGGSFIDGAIGGAISGFCQSVGTLVGGHFGAAVGKAMGTIIGGSIGSGAGTLVSGYLSNANKPVEEQKSNEELLRVAGISAGVSACTNVLTACAGAIFDYGANGYASTDIAQSGSGITPFAQTESNLMTAFFGVIDDIIAYETAEELTE